MATRIYIGHPDLVNSGSQRYLLESGKGLSSVEFIDLSSNLAAFDLSLQTTEITKCDQIILQFPLYWYQAPSVIKEWVDQILGSIPTEVLKGKTLGLVVIAGTSPADYQVGTRVGRSLSELLSSFEALARYKQMIYQPIFAIHQFQYMNELEKMKLLWLYRYRITHLEPFKFVDFVSYLLENAHQIQWKDEMDQVEQLSWNLYTEQIEQQLSELVELQILNF